MCGRFASTSDPGKLAEELGVTEVRAEQLPERYNVAPTNRIYAVANSSSSPSSSSEGGEVHRVLDAFRWGLVPSWAKDLAVGYKMINARSEGIAAKPAYRRALVKRRCIIPVDYYYEWQARAAEDPSRFAGSADGAAALSPELSPEGKGRVRKPKVTKLPWAIHRLDGQPMFMAGLWEVWRDPADPDAEPLRTATIVTTAANPGLAPIHDRMPVIFDAAGVDAWLDPSLADGERLAALLVPAPVDWFAAHPVSTLVNKVGTDGPELLAPIPDPPAGVDLGVHLPR